MNVDKQSVGTNDSLQRRCSNLDDPNYFNMEFKQEHIDLGRLLIRRSAEREVKDAWISSASTSSISVDPDVISDVIGCNQDEYQSAEDFEPNYNPLRLLATSSEPLQQSKEEGSKLKTDSGSFRQRVKVRRRRNKTISK